jgi:DNA-directed RNA polymerase specialized sigma24 family protein
MHEPHEPPRPLPRDEEPPEPSFEAFYARHLQTVALTVALAHGDLEVAREATDEAFVRTLEAWSRVSRLASPLGWTCRVALSAARRATRHHGPRGRHRADLVAHSATRFDLVPELWPFHERVAGLPERQRVAVVLRYAADLSEDDVAVAMGVRRRTVAATLQAAFRGLARDDRASRPPCAVGVGRG